MPYLQSLPIMHLEGDINIHLFHQMTLNQEESFRIFILMLMTHLGPRRLEQQISIP